MRSAILALAAIPAVLAHNHVDADAAEGGKKHTVTVGKDGQTFSPNMVEAAVGDEIEFVFANPNHSVTQSSFGKPCEKLNETVFSNKEDFSIKVVDESPIWFYCGVGEHCKNGMVGAINAPTDGDRTFQAFQDIATGKSEGPEEEDGDNGNAAPGTAVKLGLVGSTVAMAVLFGSLM